MRTYLFIMDMPATIVKMTGMREYVGCNLFKKTILLNTIN